MVCSESQNPRELDLDGPTLPDRLSAASQFGTITTSTENAGVFLQEDQQEIFEQLPDAERLPWRHHLPEDYLILPDLERIQTRTPVEQLTRCSDEDTQSGSPKSVQEAVLLSLNQYRSNCSIRKDSVNGFGSESSHKCRNIVKERKVSEKKTNINISGPSRLTSQKLKTKDVIDCEQSAFKILLVLSSLLDSHILPENGEQALQPDVYDLLANRSIGRLARELDSVLMTDSASKISLVLASRLNSSMPPEYGELELQCNACDLASHSIRQLTKELNSVPTFKISMVLASLRNSRLLPENAQQTLHPDLLAKHSIRQLARELDSVHVPMTDYVFKVLAPLLNSSLLLLLLALAELYIVNLLLFDLEFSQLLRLLVLELTGLLLSSASLLRLLHKPMRTNSSETMVMITITLSCWVKVTSSAPPHSPNLLIRMVEGEGRTYYVPLLGSPNSGYCANIAIGVKHPQEFCVLVDTGSANLAVAGKAHPDIDTWFNPQLSSNFTNIGQTVSVSYTAGDWTGTLAKDYIAIQGPSHSWYNHIEAFFVFITESQHFFINDAAWVGILGMAYGSLAKPDSSVTTFWESLRRATGMRDQFSLQFCPPLDVPLLDITEPQGGTMVLGGLNHSLYHGTILFTDIVEQRFYNVLVSNMTIGNISISLDCQEFNNDQSIVDSGTTDIFFPKAVFAEVMEAFAAHFKDGRPLPVPYSFWLGGSKLAWPADDKATIYRAFPTLYLAFATSGNASEEFSLAITPQIYLRQIEGTSAEQHDTNCFPECDFFTFGIKQRERGTVIGGNVMLGFFSLFDRESQRIGFAVSTCEYQDPHNGLPHIVGPYPRIPQDCRCHSCKPGTPYWEIISYVCGSIVCPLAIVSIICAICGRRYRKREAHAYNVNCCKRVKMSLGCSFFRCCCCARRINYSIAEVGGEEEAGYLVPPERRGAARSTEVTKTVLEIDGESGSELGEEKEGEVSLEGEGATRSTEVTETVLEIDGESGSELGEEKEGEVSLEGEGAAMSMETELHSLLDNDSELRGREGKGGHGDERTSPLPAHEETALLSAQIESKLTQSEGTPTAERSRAAEPTCEGTPLLETEFSNETESSRTMSKYQVRRGRHLKRSSRPEKATQSDQRNHSLIHGVSDCKDSTSSVMRSAVKTGKPSHTVFEQNLPVEELQAEFEQRHGRTAELSDRHQCKSEVHHSPFQKCKLVCETWRVDTNLNLLPDCIPGGVTTRTITKKESCPRDEGYCSRQVSRQDSQKVSEDSMHRIQVARQRSSGMDSAIGDTSESDSDGV